ncbi:MAG: hypothetical protein ACM3O8_00655 [Methylococcaceae bacterium]|nr:hypothetical protein [Prolixibacteraceae bacterium]
MEKTKKERRPDNFGTARYIVETYGTNVSDEKIIEVAKSFKMNPKILLKNYKTVSDIKNIFSGIYS